MLDTDPENRYRLLKNYLNAYDAEIEDSTLLTRSAFFEAIFDVFDAVIQRAVATKRSAKQPAIQTVIAPLARLNYRGSGNRALLDRRAIASLMHSTLRTTTPISTEML